MYYNVYLLACPRNVRPSLHLASHSKSEAKNSQMANYRSHITAVVWKVDKFKCTIEISLIWQRDTTSIQLLESLLTNKCFHAKWKIISIYLFIHTVFRYSIFIVPHPPRPFASTPHYRSGAELSRSG